MSNKKRIRKSSKVFIRVCLKDLKTLETIHIIDTARWRTKKEWAVNPHIYHKTPKGYQQIYISPQIEYRYNI